MACRYREELVGKRFISVRSPVKLKIGKISEWEWRSGIVRAISSRDTSSLDLSVLIEFDDIDWTRREWVRIHDIFQLFLVEHTLVWAERPDPDKPRQSVSWPGLSFRAVVDKVGLSGCKRKPVEFLVDRFLGLVEEKEIQIFQEGEENSHGTAVTRKVVQLALKGWLDYQDGQKILLTTPTVLVGYRLEVYRAEGTTQWYTAVIQSYNHTSKTLSVTDDTVLEEHNEDPTLIQMHLIDDGVVDSILRGVEIGGIAPRRRPRAVKQEKEQPSSTTKSCVLSTPTTSVVSRATISRKARTLQQQQLTSVVSVPILATPLPAAASSSSVETQEPTAASSTADKPETRGPPSDKSNTRSRQQTSRDSRRRKLDSDDSFEESNIVVKKRNSPEDSCVKSSKSVIPAKTEATQVTSVDTVPPLRVSPRHTPSKEKIRPLRTREIDKETPPKERDKSVDCDGSSKNSVKVNVSVKAEDENNIVQGKTKFKSRRREEKVDVTSRSTESPKTRSDVQRVRNESPRSRLNRTPTQTPQAESVIKTSSNSGSKKEKKVADKSDKKSNSAKSTSVSDTKSAKKDPSSISASDHSSNETSVVKNVTCKGDDTITKVQTETELVEAKIREIKSALEGRKDKDKDIDNVSKGKGGKHESGVNSVCQGKQTKRKERKEKKGTSNAHAASQRCTDTVSGEPNKTSRESDKIDESGDNMHYIKKKQSLLTGGGPPGKPQTSGIPTSNIDLNQSVTDQIARAEKLSNLNSEDKAGSVSSTLSSPVSESYSERAERDNEFIPQSRDKHIPNSLSSGSTNNSWSQDERSQSRNSEERCSSGFSDEVKRPGSRVEELRSTKNSPASSPLIVDKSEPVQIYRDPVLMSKNPVRSNVPNMHSSHKAYPTVHNPIPTQASRPASVGMTSPSLTMSSALERTSRTPVMPSVAYPSPLPLGPSLSGLLPHGLHQLDPATLAIHQQMVQQQQQHISALAASQYNNSLSMSYPPRGSLNSAQLENLWQQKYPSIPVPPPYMLAKHQEELVRGVRLLHEHEQLERERLERDRERDMREREQRKERERRERERQEKERADRERREREKLEQERAERIEREKIEKERQERERRERDRVERERVERSRILKESVDSQLAVDQHFSESLRLAKQRNWKRPSHPNNMQDGYQHHHHHQQQQHQHHHPPSANHHPKYTAAQTGSWPSPSITLGTGKPKMDPQSGPGAYKHEKLGGGEIKPEEKIKQEQLRETDYRYAEMMRKQQEHMSQQEQFLKQQKRLVAMGEYALKQEVKMEPGKDMKPISYAGYQQAKREAAANMANVKPESGVTANFNLYGYQPEKCSYITADQLHSYELDKTKGEKMVMDSKVGLRPHSPRKDMSIPPPLIKDTKGHSSVIVENKLKEGLKSMSPHHAHQQYASHMSPHHHPKPAHTPERNLDRGLVPSSSPGSLMMGAAGSIAQSHHLAALKAEAARHGTSRSQSPLRIASPQQLSAAVMQPMDYRCSPAGGNKSRGSPGSGGSPHSSVAPTSAAQPGMNTSKGFTPAIAQPPVSLPQSSVAYTFSLIQQGLVPNPIYTSTSSSSKPQDSQRTVSVTGTAQVPRAAHSPHHPGQGRGNNPQQLQQQQQQPSQQSAMSQGTKRKTSKEGNGRKRQKPDGVSGPGMTSPGSNNNPLNLSVPVTTPQVLTNQSPYTTSSVTVSSPSTTQAGPAGTTNTTQSAAAATTSASSKGQQQQQAQSAFSSFKGCSGYMDSFKAFVDSTVQSVFLSDPELAKAKEGQGKGQLKDVKAAAAAGPQPPSTSQPYKPKSSLERSCTPVISQQTSSSSSANTAEDSSSNVTNTSGNNSNSALSYVETINRVANGQVDTDSDTLSAPSPPPHLKQENNSASPQKSAKHPNLKKAWLQRHSDEDKQEVVKQEVPVVAAAVAAAAPLRGPPVAPMEVDNSEANDLSAELEADTEKDKDQLKHCYVNCSYISPSKEGGSKSPISAIQNVVIPNGTVEKTGNIDESTTSASETEVQATDNPNSRKRIVKTKKERNTPPKKTKTESDDNAAPSTPNSNQTKKKIASRRSKENKSRTSTDLSEETIKKIVENCKESAKEMEKKEEPKPTEEAYDQMFEMEDSSSSKPDLSGSETSKSEQNTGEEPSETESSRKTEKKDKKKNKDKKDKKNKKEKSVKVKEEEEEEMPIKNEGVSHQLPPPILKETELKVNQSTTFAKPLVRVPVSELRKTCEPFLQDGSCSEVTPKLMKCRECKMTPTQRGKTVPNIFCRFYAFRRLKYSQRGFVTIDGFSELTDAEQDDIDPWIPKLPIIEPKIDAEAAKFIIRRVGDKFCELVQQEREAQKCAGGEHAKIAWKRAVTGVREMCDVCDTTLFNMHWVCHKCGFVVCLDCYKVKTKEMSDSEDEVEDEAEKSDSEDGKVNEVQRQWLTCSANRQPHDVDKLMLTQIIPSDALWEVGRMVHDVRERWLISHYCPCSPKLQNKKNGIKTELMQEAIKHLSPKKKMVNGIGGEDTKSNKNKNGNIKNAVYHPDSSSPLSLLADVASMDSEKARDRSASPFSKKKEGKHGKSYTPITEPVSPGSSEKKTQASCSTLRELLTKTVAVKNNSESNKKKSNKNTSSLDDVIKKQVEKQIPKEGEKYSSSNSNSTEPMKLMHYTPRMGLSHLLVRDSPIVVHNLSETSVLYPDVPHSWLCDGRLLRLHDARHRGNLKIFMEQWRRGQPVLVSGVEKQMTGQFWSPDYFSRQFGEIENDLINCRTGCVVVGQPMKHFWDGFGVLEERLVDEDGVPMLLKLKDWPPSDDFSDVLPKQFNDLMQALPLPEYTRRDGRLNLVSRLPDFLVKPDLGPKMYIAYGSAQYPKEGTTNLHLDVSDACNVMVYVGFLEDDQKTKVEKEDVALRAIDMAKCDNITRRRVREVREVPGALWHIFDAVDADKIRDFLNKVGKERGDEVEQHHDPIHDQSWYLDEDLRERLASEYGVLGYTIIQCLGDAIFIPAGAPHQVRNLNNCIKVAEDFVSPEHLHHCFRLTQEFRHLSDGHSNHEDKLQVKNIIYHAVKDAVAVLSDMDAEEYEENAE